ncbi:MAG TPA: adenosylhomocysteinase [Methylomusa anaerophila]|uniref:Adenosylhomocysteinase n=1 Tax=Methylomusa anaerophila TaxID=1930071 RepID=A0A348APR9_9FIRM|nr:adenosylhomocysteinase [Methylomusa anaerophila]BBB93067.1 adenosylhomocysteinase [Methylomusa anaerophila]HML87100.1 adenosylhomocysteinase [Methylomusa anaerophila]
MESLIRDLSLAPQGQDKINWVKEFMPVLNVLNDELSQTKPLAGKNMVITMHLEAKTAYLALVMKNAGANVTVTGSNPLSTQDDVAAALASQGVKVFAWYNCTAEEYENFLHKALDTKPEIIIDDGGDLVSLLHGERSDLAANILGGSEETTTGVLRLRALAAAGRLKFPMIAVNDAYCKYLFDNRYGTGQSTWDGIMRTTNLTVTGKTVVIAGYGWCGKGVSMRAKGLGANVIVTEIDPIKAIEAVFDGFIVLPMQEAASRGDIFVTLTGCKDVIRREHMEVMKSGAVMANAGHFDVEINKHDLAALSKSRRVVRKNIEEFAMTDGRKLYLLAEGRLVNLAAGDGHPTEIMDLSFAMQALAALHIVENHKQMDKSLYTVTPEMDNRVAALKLKAMGVSIDNLTEEQAAYLSQA